MLMITRTLVFTSLHQFWPTFNDPILFLGDWCKINENEIIKDALITLNKKKLGFIVIVNNDGLNSGIFTDGDLKRSLQKNKSIEKLKIKTVMSKKPFAVEENTLISDIISKMNKRKITSVCVYNKKNRKKTIGVIHIHHILKFLK